MVEKFGDWFTYEHTARANIFRRDHSKVKDMESMLKLMRYILYSFLPFQQKPFKRVSLSWFNLKIILLRYNDFTHDPLSKCNCTPPYSAENAISARCDLNPINGTYPFGALGHRSHGGTDSKVRTVYLFICRKLLHILLMFGLRHKTVNFFFFLDYQSGTFQRITVFVS